MLTASASTIADVTRGEIIAGNPSAIATDLVIDSRLASPGCAFAALPGERANGHEFAEAAVERGARVLLVANNPGNLAQIVSAAEVAGAAVVRVEDVARAVRDIAAYHRSRLSCRVVGITGSTGKTTTKDFVDAVLSAKFRVACTIGNRNNELGVPLTVLCAGPDTEVLVVEMGMRGKGQIAQLAAVAKPTIALVTNVGTSHIEVLGSQEAIASTKAELVAALPADGAAFLNGDDAYSEQIAAMSAAPVTYYGLSERCTVTADSVETDDESRPSFDLVTAGGRVRVSLPIPGRHNVYNALAAAAVGLHLGVSLTDIAEALSAVTVTAMRMQLFTTANGVTVINDAYNANPVSMRAAVDTLVEMSPAGQRVAVLGDMAELGSLTELAHFQLGEHVAHSGIEALVTVGPFARRIAEGARAAGMDAGSVRPCAAVAEAVEVLDDLLGEGDAVLVKGSRVMGLEAVVEGIVNPR